MKPDTMTNEELAETIILVRDSIYEALTQEARDRLLESARRLRATPETLIVVIEKKADDLYLATTPQWKAVASDPTFDGAVSKLIGCVYHFKEWAVAHGRLEDAKKSVPASVGQGVGTEWRWLNDGETMRAGDVYSDDNPVGFRGADFNGIGSKWRNGCDLEVRRLRTVDISHGIVGKLYFTNRHSPHPLAGWELREDAEQLAACLRMIRTSPAVFPYMSGVPFTLDKVREYIDNALAKHQAALTKGPVSP